MKRQVLLFTVVLAFILVFSQFSPAQDAFAQDITVVVDGSMLSFDTAPTMVNDRVLVPMRAIFEYLGAKVLWDGDTETVTATKDGVTISLSIGKERAGVGDNIVYLDSPPILVNDRTLVPIRFVSESLGAKVDWDQNAYQVVINTGSSLSGALKLSGSTTVQPLAEKLAQAFMNNNPGVAITITGGGSGVGIQDAAEGKVNIGNVSRDLKDTDPAGLVSTTIAKDAVVVVVHPNNPVNALTKEQVKQIFTGQIINWKDVGGNDAPIIVNSRTAPSGTFDFFSETFMNMEQVVDTAKQHASNGLVRQAVATGENAIGFISMGYVDSSVKAPAMDGVAATIENAISGTYQYVRPLNMVTVGQPTGLAQEFINFILSPAGQAIASEEYIAIK